MTICITANNSGKLTVCLLAFHDNNIKIGHEQNMSELQCTDQQQQTTPGKEPDAS